MGRFLTPAKITLLVLANIYCKGQVPFAGTANVLNIILSHVIPDAKSSRETLDQADTILDYERALAGQASVVTGRTIWDLLLKEIWQIDCADALEEFINSLKQHLGKTRDELLRERDEHIQPSPAGALVRTSPLGMFIRRCALEWNRLQFQDSMALWLDLIAYRMPSKGAFVRKNPNKLKNAFDRNLADLQVDLSHDLGSIVFRPLIEDKQVKSFSSHDSDKLMEFQVSEMQSIGGRLPESMKVRLKQMAQLGASAPKLTHYLRYLDSWRAGDFISAFDNLHRYFDYTMHSRDRTYYQYALLNLAILQADFGCHDEAIPAMKEAIATARENRDTVCLNYCMSWLYHFGRTFPAQMPAIRETGLLGNESDGLNFLKSRAKESSMWSLLSTTLISEAKFNLQRGDSLTLCFENLIKASHVNIVKDISNGTGPSLILKSALFTRVGQTHLALSCTERFLLCHAKESPLEDILKCTVRQAVLLAQMGRLAESRAALHTVPEQILQVLKYKTYYTTQCLLLRARHLLRRGNIDAAEYIITRLVSQQPHPETDTSTQVWLLHVDLLIRQGELLGALQRVEKLAEQNTSEQGDVLLTARLLVLKANLFAKSDKALQGFSLTLRALHLCYSARLLPMLWEASLTLAHILNESFEFAAAKELLEAILPQILQCLDCDLSGRCYMLMADALAGLAGKEIEKAEETGENVRLAQEVLMGQAMDKLDTARMHFSWVEGLDGQLEAFAKTGKIHAWRGDLSLANETGEKYLALKKEYAEEP